MPNCTWTNHGASTSTVTCTCSIRSDRFHNGQKESTFMYTHILWYVGPLDA